MEPSKLSHELLQIVLGELHASALDPLDAVEEFPHQPSVAMLIRLEILVAGRRFLDFEGAQEV